MRKNLLLFFLLCWCKIAKGQEYNDKIINYWNDTMECKIISIENNKVYYKISGGFAFKRSHINIKSKTVKKLILDKNSRVKISLEKNAETLSKIYSDKNVSINELRKKNEDDFSSLKQLKSYQKGFMDKIIILNDTISCKITIINEMNVFYDAKDNGLLKHYKLPLSSIKKIHISPSSDAFILLPSFIKKEENTFINTSSIIDTVLPNIDRYIPTFRHSIKLSPLTCIANNLSLKYEYRLSAKIALKSELGYIHKWENELENFNVEPFYKEGYPFAWSGIMASVGISSFFKPFLNSKTKTISIEFFYKNQFHEKYNTYYDDYDEDYQLSKRRSVYGTKVLFSILKERGKFLIELFGGISFRVHVDHNIYYSGYSNDFINMTIQPYHPPKHTNSISIMPAIQGGINIGFGFNGKKKK